MRKMKRFLGFTLTTLLTLSLMLSNVLIANATAPAGPPSNTKVIVHFVTDWTQLNHVDVKVTIGSSTYTASNLLHNHGNQVDGNFTNDLNDTSRLVVTNVILYWNNGSSSTITSIHESSIGHGLGQDTLNIWIADCIAPTPSPTPTVVPTASPTVIPSTEPTLAPSTEPTLVPSTEPTLAPSTEPTLVPSTEPTLAPSTEPTLVPTETPIQTEIPVPTTEIPAAPVLTGEYPVPSTPEPTVAPTETPIIVPTPAIPEAPVATVTVTDTTVPQAATKDIVEADIPQASLPQTATLPTELFYGLGMMLGLGGLSVMRIKKDKKS